MLEQLRQLQRDVAALTSGFDPALVEGTTAKTLVELSASVVKMLVAFQSLAAGRVEETNGFGASDRSAAEWLARTAGVPLGEAATRLATTRRLAGLPEAEAAFRAGQLSLAQAKEVASGATADPSAQKELCDLAKKGDLSRLRDRSRDVRNNARGEDDEARAARLHALRSARTWMDDEGMGCGKWRLTPDAHAVVLSALELQRRKAAKVASAAGDSYETALADALVAAVSGNSAEADGTREVKSGSPRWQGVVLVDVEALRRGHVHDDERCEIDGVGSIPVTTARDLLGDASLDLILRDGLDIRSVVHLGRQFTPAQRTALIARDRTCIRPSCNAKRGLELEHRDGWANTLATSVDSGARVCRRDHDLKTYSGHRYSGQPGLWEWHLPDGTVEHERAPTDGPGH